MAKDLLAMAMSAASERFFFQVGNIVTKKQNRMLPGTSQKLAILKSQDSNEGGERQDAGVVAEEITDSGVDQETVHESESSSSQNEKDSDLENNQGTGMCQHQMLSWRMRHDRI